MEHDDPTAGNVVICEWMKRRRAGEGGRVTKLKPGRIMSRRDSDSIFHKESSPNNRYRRNEKPHRHKPKHRRSAFLENGGHMKLRDDALPHQPNDASQLPTSLSSFQHDERGGAGQIVRSSGQRKAGERGWWKDTRIQQCERAETSHNREQRDDKSQAKLDDNTFQRRFSERKDDPPTARKIPAFREKKIPVDFEDANSVKTKAIARPPKRNERREERSSNPHHLHRVEKQFADVRAPNKGEARKEDGFPFRRGYGGSAGNSNYRGRDKFNGRQGATRTEKWKHDLYQRG